MEVKVSLIIGCFNTSKEKLDRMLRSIEMQSYNKIEVVLIDDGSTDDTLARLQEWKRRFFERGYECLVVEQEHKGIPGTINTGLKLFTGDYVCIVDSDDELDCDYVNEMSGYLSSHPECGWVRCDAVCVNCSDIDMPVFDIRVPSTFDPSNVFAEYLLDRVSHVVWLLMIRREYLVKCVPSMQIHENLVGDKEWQIVLPLSFYSCFGYCQKILYKHIFYSDSNDAICVSTKERHRNYIAARYENMRDAIIRLPMDAKERQRSLDAARLLALIHIRATHEAENDRLSSDLLCLCDKYLAEDYRSKNLHNFMMYQVVAKKLQSKLYRLLTEERSALSAN